MKKNPFIILFFALQLFLVFFYIFKESQIIKLSYQKQKYEKTKKELTEHKKNLTHELHMLKNKNSIKEYARKNNMEKLKLKAIR